MDPLSDMIALLRPSAAVSKPISGRGTWGVRYAAHDQPGFTIVLAGMAWLKFEGKTPVRLVQGDFLLLPTTPAFSLSSGPDIRCEPAGPRADPVRHGEQDGEPDFIALGGSFTIERVNAPLLLSLLPEQIHIPAADGKATRFSRLVGLLADECSGERPGKDLMLRRMLEALLIEALRSQSVGENGAVAGLLNGMRDPPLARALQAIHADVRAGWTVARLAAIAGMSRSAFSSRFGEIMNCTPIEYLTRWRMAIAKEALARGAKSLGQIADEIGYESASAFSTAFRKRLGCPPGRFAREATA